jgi:hypothetical protein
MKPPVKGEANGPTKTAIAKAVIAIPRCLWSYIFAKQAGTTASGLAKKNPAKKRQSMTVWRSFAAATPIENMLKPKMPITRGSFRPESSLMGAHMTGPVANPMMYKVMSKTPTSVLTWNVSVMPLIAGEKIALAKEATKVL